jgi:phosphoribosylformylglycinamidine (FGAM) synthase-like enzyme
VTLAESCFAAEGLGASVAAPEDVAAEYALFGERGARVVVSVAPEKLGAVRNTARQYGVGAHEIGKVTSDNALRIEYKGRTVVSASVPALRDAWAHSLERNLNLQ